MEEVLDKMKVKVSENGRFLKYEGGEPFFYFADTAWEILYKARLEDIKIYLKNRSEKGFTVIQTVILSGKDHFENPVRATDEPVLLKRPVRGKEIILNPSYIEHIKDILKYADDLGIYICLLPAWGSRWNPGSVSSDKAEELVIFDQHNSYLYGKKLSNEFGEFDNIIWMLGGDRSIEAEIHAKVVRNMAKGIKDGESNHIITMHGGGPYPYSDWFHTDEWLDFNTFQSSHIEDQKSYLMIDKSYRLLPHKPVMDAEPCYEKHPVIDPPWSLKDPENNIFFEAKDIRKQAYWSVFAGGCGITYGANPIWFAYYKGRPYPNPKMYKPNVDNIDSWIEALEYEGANQLIHLKNLLLEREYYDRIPMQQQIEDNLGTCSHIQATGVKDEYLLVYVPKRKTVTVKTDIFRVAEIKYCIMNPANGKRTKWKYIENSGILKLNKLNEDREDSVIIIES